MSHTDHENNNTITMAIVTEAATQTFQLGETVAEAIAQTKLTLLPHMTDMADNTPHAIDDIDMLVDIPRVELTVITNSEHLNKWCNEHGHNATLVDDEGIIDTIKNDTATMVIVVPAAQHIAINPEEGIALVPNESNIIIRAQEELLRVDEHGERAHSEALIALMMPPEYRVVQSALDPDTYIRIIATPSYINTNNSDTETNEDA